MCVHGLLPVPPDEIVIGLVGVIPILGPHNLQTEKKLRLKISAYWTWRKTFLSNCGDVRVLDVIHDGVGLDQEVD